MMWRPFLCLTFASLISVSIEEDCLKFGISTQCCADFYLKEKECIPCPRGYFGLNCSYMCPYPTFGRRCLDGKCTCPKEYCDAETGCGTPCPSGQYGPNCIHICPYPSFGRRCLEGNCQCPVEQCDPTTGCKGEDIILKSNDNAILEKETSKGYIGNVVSPTIEENIQTKGKTEELNRPESKSTPTPVIVTSVVAALIIIALIAVILFQVKSKIQTRIQTFDSKRRSKVTSQRHADTYCDIDENKMEDVECSMDNELETYESIDQSKKDATKYTELPTRQGISKQERKLLSTISMQKILDDPDDDKVKDKHVDGSESKVQMRTDKVLHDVLPKRMGKTSTKISGYIDMRKNTPEDYVSMNAEQLDTDAISQTGVDSMHNVS